MTWQPHETDLSDGRSLADFLRENPIDDLLIEKKALVFRGFGVTEPDLDAPMDLLLPNRLAYVHGNSPRTKVGQNVYTSTEYLAEYTISMHNELSYAASWPSRLMFFCAKAAETGGATPVVDGVTWLESLDPEVREAFAKGVRYTQQNLHGGWGSGRAGRRPSRPPTRRQVETFLDASSAEWTWRSDGGLRVTQIRPATTPPPGDGRGGPVQPVRPVAPGVARRRDGDDARGDHAAGGPPQSVQYADGTPIPAEHVIQARDQGLEHAVDVDPRGRGDVLLIDSVLVGHGRAAVHRVAASPGGDELTRVGRLRCR